MSANAHESSGIGGAAAPHHSHKKLYIITGVILALATVVELFIPFIEELGNSRGPILVVLAVAKLAGVIGIFMHLKDDRTVFRLVFLAPLVMAVLAILVLGLLGMPHFAAYGGGYVKLAPAKSLAERGFASEHGSAAAPAAPAAVQPFLTEAQLDEALAAAAGDLSAGKAVFTANCAACHGQKAEGMVALGPNMTDDCYVHGGKMTDIMGVILNGVPGKAMVGWRPTLKDDQIRDVVLYLRSLRGSNIAGGQPCQGEKM